MRNFNKMYKRLSISIILCLSLIFIVISIYICNYKNNLNKVFMFREISQQEREIKSKIDILSERNINEGENHEFENVLKIFQSNLGVLESELEKIKLELCHLQSKNKYILDVSIVDRNGIVVESSIESNIGKDLKKDNNDILEKSILYKCSAYFDSENKSINLISPVYDKISEEVLGYYSKSISIKYVQDILESYNRDDKEHSFLILSDENFITDSTCKVIDVEALTSDKNKLCNINMYDGKFIKYIDYNGNKMRAIVNNIEYLDTKIVYSMKESSFIKDIIRLITMLFIICTLICILFLYLARKILNNIRYDFEQVSKMIYEYEKTGGISNEFLEDKKMFNLIGKEVFNIIKRFEIEKINYDYIKNKYKLDCLTGVLNKEYTKKYIEEYIKESNEGGAFILFDLDNFKDINDSFGHQFGDEVLKEISKKAKDIFRDTDIFGRIGGDEFVVFVKGDNIEEIINSMLYRLNEVLKGQYSKGNISYDITGSIGACIYPKDAVTYEKMYNNADIAMYHSKEQGKNKFTLYNKDIKTKLQREDESISKALDALDEIKDHLCEHIKLIPVKRCEGDKINSYVLCLNEYINYNDSKNKDVIHNIVHGLNICGLDQKIYTSILKEVFKLIGNVQSKNKEVVIDIMTLFRLVPYKKVISSLELAVNEARVNTNNIRIFLSKDYIEFLGDDTNVLISKLKYLGFGFGVIEFNSNSISYEIYSKYDIDEIYICNKNINYVMEKEEGLSFIKHCISYYRSIGVNVTLGSIDEKQREKIWDLDFKYCNINDGIDIKGFINNNFKI